MTLDSMVVDSVVTVFNQGVKASILAYTIPFVGVLALLMVVGLLHHSIKKG